MTARLVVDKVSRDFGSGARAVHALVDVSLRVAAVVLPLVRKTGDIWDGSNSRASADDPISRWTRYESHSPDPRT